MANYNKRKKYMKIASCNDFVERSLYNIRLRKMSKSPLWHLIHCINRGWHDEMPKDRKQYSIKRVEAVMKKCAKLSAIFYSS